MATRRVRTRGGRRGGYSGGSSFSGSVNRTILAFNQRRLMDIYPHMTNVSAFILLELCEGNLARAIDNVAFAQELRENVFSIFKDQRKLAITDLSDEQSNQAAAQKPTESTLIPSTSSGEHNVTQSESLQQNECPSEPNQTSQFMEDNSTNEELITAVDYITEHVEHSPNDTSGRSQQLQNEKMNCELFFEDNITSTAARERKEHVKHEVYANFSHTQSISEQQSPQTVSQNQKVNQRPEFIFGDKTYVMRKLPKDLPLTSLPSVAKHREILQKLVNQPMQTLKQS